MARAHPLSGLVEFEAVARHLSFRAAAAELGVSPAAVSVAMRALETRLGLPLFVRTTRRVALSDAGAALLARLQPALVDVGGAVEAVRQLRSAPTGRLRLTVPRIALDTVLVPALPQLRSRYPDIELEIDVDDASVDMTARGFDAGIRIGEFIDRDMVAVRLTPDFRWTVLGAPAYLAEHGRPRTPRDLMSHQCIRYRFPTAKSIYRWTFAEGARSYTIDPPGSIVVTDHLTMVSLAAAGLGLAYTATQVAAPQIAAGTLVPVLKGHLPTTSGLFLYFAQRSQAQPKLRALIEVLRDGVSRRG